jgi:hypothetical protein
MSVTNEDGAVLEKNAKVANMWSSGGLLTMQLVRESQKVFVIA